jgi:hypothetical protein
VPLEKLRLVVTSEATGRAEYIRFLNRGPPLKASIPVFNIDRWKKAFGSRITKVLLGIQVPAAASMNWPSTVQSEYNSELFDDEPFQLPLVKFHDPNEGGTCYYRRAQP